MGSEQDLVHTMELDCGRGSAREVPGITVQVWAHNNPVPGAAAGQGWKLKRRAHINVGASRDVAYQPAAQLGLGPWDSEELLVGVQGFAGCAHVDGSAVVKETVPGHVLVLPSGVVGGAVEDDELVDPVEAVTRGCCEGDRLVDAVPLDLLDARAVLDVHAVLDESAMDEVDAAVRVRGGHVLHMPTGRGWCCQQVHSPPPGRLRLPAPRVPAIC